MPTRRLVIFLLSLALGLTAAAQAQAFDPAYEERAQRLIAELTRLNGLRGWKPDDPASWPQVPPGAPGGRLAAVRWSSGQPARLELLSLVNMKLQRAADFSSLSELKELELASNSLRAVNLDGSHSLRSLGLSANQLASLRLAPCPGLERLNVSNNQLASLDLSANEALKELSVSANQLSQLDLSRQSALESLEAINNRLGEISVDSCPNLTRLWLSHNRLKALKLENNPRLAELGLRDNELSEISLSANMYLRELNISGNRLNRLHLSSNTLLTSLAASGNQLTELDLSGHDRLQELSLANNPLRKIEVGANLFSALQSLNLDGCRLPLSQLAFWAGRAERRARLGTQTEALFSRLELETGQTLDLSTEAFIDGQESEFSVLTDRRRRAKPEAYELSAGRVTFQRPGRYLILMSNEKVYSSDRRGEGQPRRSKVKVYTGLIEVRAPQAGPELESL